MNMLLTALNLLPKQVLEQFSYQIIIKELFLMEITVEISWMIQQEIIQEVPMTQSL
jgi:hypothetical protein